MDGFRCESCGRPMRSDHWVLGDGVCQACWLEIVALVGLGLLRFDSSREGLERFRRRVSIESLDKEVEA